MTSVVRVDVGSKIGGTGFVMSDGRVMTCAHVVADSDGRPQRHIRVVVHTTREERRAEVVPEFWRQPSAEDIAVLSFDGELPQSVTNITLGPSVGTSGDFCVVFGYPEVGLIDGLWGHGIIVGPVAERSGRQLIQIDSKEITRGFSGAPLFNKRTRQVMGMVSEIASADPHGRLDETAFAIPSETLAATYPPLQIAPTTITGPGHTRSEGQRRRTQLRLERLQQQWDLVFDKLTRFERALTLETDEGVRFRLEHQVLEAKTHLARAEEEMEQLESSL
jgi:S1-C subfamily serine protease